MQKRIFIALAMVAIVLSSCMKQTDNEEIIGKQMPKIENRRFSAEALWAMGRIGSVAVNQQTGDIAYNVTYYSVEKNKSNSELFLLPADRNSQELQYKQAVQLTKSAYRESDPAWTHDGMLAYLSSESGQSQIWLMDALGNLSKRHITGFDDDIEGFSFSPDGSKVLFVAQVKTATLTKDLYPDLPLATGRVIDDLMYKHWDEWVETAPHPFIADFDGYKLSNIKDLLEGEPYESPMKPFGGMEQLAWSPDGKQIAYTCRKKTGYDYAVSTNSDIFLYNTETGEHYNLTEGMMGYDTNPQFSPDGKHIAWLSMEHDGYESDQNRLFVFGFYDGEKQFISRPFESNVDDFRWLNNEEIVFAGCWHALVHLYTIDLYGNMHLLTDGQYDYSLADVVPDRGVICKRHSMCEADEIYLVDTHENVKQLTFENKHIYDAVDMGTVEPIWQTTTDGKQMLTWIVYPPHFDPTKKYPTLLYCEGGPQSPVSQFWSYRWNFMMMASHDYIVVAPNRRGLPGFGLEWNEEISGDYGGQCMRDYLTAIDDFSKQPFVDSEHLGAVGASFGGFSVYWLAGNHNKRFKAFIAHDGIFNMEMQYLETEEKWFANWDMGGAYWEKDNKIAQRTFSNSPHRFVDKWDTPILCIHGEKDYRILANQGMAAFDAAKMRGIPAELLIFPDENHWVLKPQNGILWQRTFYNWLDKWLK